MASAANGGGTKITVAFASVSFAACDTVSNTGKVQMFGPALARHYAAHYLRAVSDRLLRVERAFLAGESLHDQSSILIYQYAHLFP